MSTTAAVAVSPAQDTQEAAYYNQHGYVVLPGLVSEAKIDRLMDLYRRDILPSDSKFFRQSTNAYETNRINEHGYVAQSFLDVHAYKSFPEFREAVMEIYFAPEVLEALTRITGSARHNLMQSMLFDLNAATPPHQDWWYLDSVPNGHLLAAWIALEDIDERAGRFYVMPGSQTVNLHEAELPHSKWLERMADYVEKHRSELHAPAMKKGDVMFWNSRTVHGSLHTIDPRFSRKSLTAHYLPSEMTYGNLFASKPWVKYEDWKGQQYFANQPEYSLKADLASRVKVSIYDNPTLLKVARKFQKKALSDLK
ncbi:phytanoyl-CoA dioxygenase family protein [Aquabacterium sp. A7-Y]|uniref:phytanoyl-CoA dioxygenase family protein n=1 Tax=Aquabacterium sp. A7-Y TaxID=1349605 RepID=UPI00223E5DA7|nr:phytanoyl-CoA dioxygenase family protein [Aquabacterium sp. A7-Y]MCW7537297.1 phytanoyl-CoA dioxygenase family protein [Aquabacterium sp. A7-Y]